MLTKDRAKERARQIMGHSDRRRSVLPHARQPPLGEPCHPFRVGPADGPFKQRRCSGSPASSGRSVTAGTMLAEVICAE